MPNLPKIFPLLLFLLLPQESLHAAMEKQTFEQIVDLFQHLYAKEFQQQRHRLRILGQWETERLEASARREEDRHGQLAVITVGGGLARHPRMTEGALALVICHEIGHFLAGKPAFKRFSTEGQADYFAAASCMRRFLMHLPYGRRPGDQGAPHRVVQRCAWAFRELDEWQTCVQTTMSGYALSRFFADRKNIEPPRFETPDPSTVNVLGFATPTVQCRLDTFSAAALCNPGVENATEHGRPWLCSRFGALSHAARPPCWYPVKENHTRIDGHNSERASKQAFSTGYNTSSRKQ